MIRKIIKIDQELCNGCGLCAKSCHEGAIGMVEGKARLLRDDYCDGLGDCLPVCPTDAITFEERDAAAYDEAAVKANMQHNQQGKCPGSRPETLSPGGEAAVPAIARESRLKQWPVQIQLAPINAPYFQGADLLIAADCTAFAHGDFHNRFMSGKVTLIGCPKLDRPEGGAYSKKLAAIFRHNEIRSVTVVRMEVPCCGGMPYAVEQALVENGKEIPVNIAVLSVDGQILEQ